MIHPFVRSALAIALLLFFSLGADARIWHFNTTVQNGTSGEPGYGGGGGTLGMTGWFTQNIGGSTNDPIYGHGTGPGYACLGLTKATPTCAAAATPEIWTPGPVVYSGSVNDDLSFLNLTWTGQAGTAPVTVPELFTSSITNGSYDENGIATGTFSCWNNPASVPSFGYADFCGNGTGGAAITTAAGQDITSRYLTGVNGGLIDFIDNGDYTMTIMLASTAYSDCAADPNCVPNASAPNEFVQFTLNQMCATSDGPCCGTDETEPCPPTVPIPAALWLFGSALGLLGWLRRKKI
jgi:hypothetical protein